MPSLTDLFNPTFLMFLGILVLVVALLVVYFETKFREQNHKISSMLSLVSSLAEEVNGSKMIIHQLTMNHQPQNPQFFHQQQQQLNLEKQYQQNNNLILVSDDEEDSEEEDEIDSDSDAASEVSIDENVLDDDDDDDDSVSSVIELGESSNSNDVKVLKLNISDNKDDSESGDEVSLDEMDDLDELEDLDDSSTSSVSIKEEKNDNVKSMDFKSINITLEETKPEQPLDYKKMALPKLRSIVAEKGLSSDSSKLKKNELLKLLGAE